MRVIELEVNSEILAVIIKIIQKLTECMACPNADIWQRKEAEDMKLNRVTMLKNKYRGCL